MSAIPKTTYEHLAITFTVGMAYRKKVKDFLNTLFVIKALLS